MKRVETEGNIRHPAEGIQAAAGITGMLFERVAAVCNIRRQITGRGRGQLITEILSVQADAVPDQLLFAEAVKSVMLRDPFPAWPQ